MKNPQKTFGIQGGIISLPYKAEKELAFLLGVKAKWGFGESQEGVKELVFDYVQENLEKNTPEGAHLRKHCCFKVSVPNFMQ